jgi:phosphoribosyl 1,2-cyclic phosphodiesterase
MKVNILASGSQGNCIALQSGGTCILIDAGIARTKIEKKLLEGGIRADEIAAIFITHSHSDHIKGLPLANKYHIPVYASEGEWKSIKNVDEDLKNVIEHESILLDYEGYQEWMEIIPFDTHHDAISPKGYVVVSDDAKCSICLDTGKVDDEMYEAMKDSDIYIIESNHEPNMVEVSDYPNSVKARILSHVGHLSNEQTAEALSRLIQGKGERIYLTHLSSNNNMPMLAEMTVKRALKAKGFTAGKHYELEVI